MLRSGCCLCMTVAWCLWIFWAALFELNAQQKIFRYMIRCTNLYGRLGEGQEGGGGGLAGAKAGIYLEGEGII